MPTNIRQKLLNIQMELKAHKSQFNKFGNYNYRSCEDILEAVKPLCKKHNLLLMITDEMVVHGERFYVKSTAIICEVEGEIDQKGIACVAFARESLEKKGMDSSQITGSTSSYARKYALNGLFCIDDTRDADTQDNTAKPEKADSSKEHKKEMTEFFSGAITTTIGEVNFKEDISKKGKKYKLYHILGENEIIYNTLDKNLAEKAKEAMGAGLSVLITVKDDKWKNNIETLEIINE